MLKEVRYVVYLLTIFFFIFFVIKFYLSENNIKRSNKIILQYQNELNKKFINLPIIKGDTNDIIEYTNEIEKFKNKKQRKFWDLLKTSEK
jgi:metal-responsive CopG/Arc/MetJ family transcriptional regulator